MGISGLLPLLKSIHRQKHIRDWAGQTVGVDAYGWLHRGTIACAVDLALGNPTLRYVDFAMGRVRMLKHFGVTPYLVFDGDYLPSKAATESEREGRREQCKKKGLELLKLGKSSAAYLELQKAIDVTPLMARHLIDACKAIGVSYIVAPYEADAQLYYLEKTGVINAVLSEDSDLLVFGCRSLITKMDQFGECVEINRDDFSACKGASFAGWTDAEFRHMAILSGCDYLASIPRMGLKTAHRLVRKHKTFEKVVRAIQFDGQLSVPVDYLDKFKQADMTFLHQRVFCPTKNMLVMCNEPEEPLSDDCLIYIGVEIELELARGVAQGELDPMTKEPFVFSKAVKNNTPIGLVSSSWNQPKKLETPKNNKSITSFFKPQSEPKLMPRTPLQQISTNSIASRGVLSAPHQGTVSSPLMTKRMFSETTVKSENISKKPRTIMDDPSDFSENVTSTGERSTFFQASGTKQSRRSLGSPTSQPSFDGICKENGAPKTPQIKASPKSACEKTDAPVSVKYHSRNHAVATPTPAPTASSNNDSIAKVTQGWKEKFSCKATTTTAVAPSKLSSSIIQNRNNNNNKRLTTASSSSSRSMSSLQRIGAGAMKTLPQKPPNLRLSSFKSSASLNTSSSSISAKSSTQIPHTIIDNTSADSSSQEEWPEFVGITASRSQNLSQSQSQSQSREGTPSQSQSQSQGKSAALRAGDGFEGFSKFVFKGR